MKAELIFLGTGSMQPTKQRNHAAVVLRTQKETLLFDCGEGTQRQFRIAGLKPSRVSRLFLTHWHGDHAYGIPGFLSAVHADGFEGKFEFYGPRGTRRRMKLLQGVFAAKENLAIDVNSLRSGPVLQTEDFSIECRELDHSTNCLGYVYQEKPKRRFDKEKIKGIDGVLIGKLQAGERVMVDGRVITADDVSSMQEGLRIAYVTDTRPCYGAQELARNCDVLIIEATHLHELHERTEMYKHMTVREAATLAQKAKVKRLVLTHISQRYKDDKAILAEAKEYFSGDVVVAYDFMRLEI